MLNTYLLQTQELLQNPPAPNPLYATANLIDYINRARLILAGDAECVRVYGQFSTVVGQRQYPFSALNVATVNPAVSAPFNLRYLWYAVGDPGGQASMRPRGWPWFSQYKLNNPVPQPGAPQVWSQYGQGDSGSLFIDPIPDDVYTIFCDTVCVPIALVDDTTAEAIPYPWTDAVPFFAAYYALLSAQAPARQADAERMMQRYEEFKTRARRMSNPSILPGLYEQSAPVVSKANQLGAQSSGGGG